MEKVNNGENSNIFLVFSTGKSKSLEVSYFPKIENNSDIKEVLNKIAGNLPSEYKERITACIKESKKSRLNANVFPMQSYEDFLQELKIKCKLRNKVLKNEETFEEHQSINELKEDGNSFPRAVYYGLFELLIKGGDKELNSFGNRYFFIFNIIEYHINIIRIFFIVMN